MKILFVQKMNGISGSELYLLQIMPELKRRGYDVEMLIVFPKQATSNGRFISYLAEHNVPVHELYGHHDLSPVLFYKIRKLIHNGKFNLIQANLIHADLWLSVIKFLSMPGMKLISCKHGYDADYQAKYGFDLRFIKKYPYYWIEKFACRFIDRNITISRALHEVFVTGKIAKPERVTTVYYGLTLKAPVDQSVQTKVPDGSFALITGRLLEVKGHRYLLEAWKSVKATCPGLKLYLAGDGVLQAELEQQVKAAGMEQDVFFLGFVPNPHPLVERSMFTIVTSTWEGFGLILLESWLHKKPIVAFDAPAMNEVIDEGVNGLLVPFKDTVKLAEKITWMYHNQDKAADMGKNGNEKLLGYYSLKRMTDETEQIYSEVARIK